MIITRLKLQNFKRFSGLDLRLEKGINILVGNNETGKSTVANALLEALFTDPATQMQKFGTNYPWSGARDMHIELEFTHDGNEFLLVKDFARKSVDLKNLKTGKSISGHKDVLQAVAELTGIGSREIYTATAYISQSDIAAIETDQDFISALQNAAGTGDLQVNVQSLIKSLDNERRHLLVGLDHPAKYPGEIKQVQDQLKSLQKDSLEKQQLWQKLAESVDINQEAEKELKSVKEKSSTLQRLLENFQKNEEARKKLQLLDKELTDLQEKIQSLEEKLDKGREYTTELKQFGPFAVLGKEVLEQTLKNIPRLQEQRKFLQGDLEEYESMKETKDTGLPKFKLTGVLIAAGLVAGVSVAIGIMLNNLLVPAVTGILAVVFIIVVFALKIRERNLKRSSAIFERDLKKKRIELKQQLISVDEQLQNLLDKFEVSSAEQFFTEKARFTSLSESLREVTAEIKGILGAGTLEDLKKRQIKLLNDKKAIEVTELTEEVKQARLNPSEFITYSRELERLQDKKEQLELDIAQAGVRVSDSTVTVDDLTNLAEQIEIAQNNLEYFKNYERVLELTIYGLEEAIKETARNANALVSKELEYYLPLLTKKRYENARLTKDLDVEVFSNEKNDWVKPIGILSKGTIDQIYFLTRLAFLKVLTGQKSVPIILDDPFVTFDNERMAAVQEILEELSTNTQIVLLTFSSKYHQWGKELRLQDNLD
ncbi:MAG TPA: AAA family ATPase [Candidatus Dojkabacteria bacterium]|nr:AAA family ATPase [Candidatus Dojkabacteria bacterium]